MLLLGPGCVQHSPFGQLRWLRHREREQSGDFLSPHSQLIPLQTPLKTLLQIAVMPMLSQAGEGQQVCGKVTLRCYLPNMVGRYWGPPGILQGG